jgi:hypothetical protein
MQAIQAIRGPIQQFEYYNYYFLRQEDHKKPTGRWVVHNEEKRKLNPDYSQNFNCSELKCCLDMGCKVLGLNSGIKNPASFITFYDDINIGCNGGLAALI